MVERMCVRECGLNEVREMENPNTRRMMTRMSLDLDLAVVEDRVTQVEMVKDPTSVSCVVDQEIPVVWLPIHHSYLVP